jgi:Cu-processing system ATP-binding protein
VIIYRDVVKRFGTQVAVDRFSMPVATGEVVALLGPNGSGKTTTLKIAAGLIRPDGGEVVVGEPPRVPWAPEARRVLSFLPQRVAFPEALSGREVVEFYCHLRGLREQRVEAVLRFASLASAADRHVATYSGGMVQRLGLAVALLPEPEALLLDEPTAALDPDGLEAFYAALHAYRRQGRTVLFTSHQVGDVERLADRFVVLVNGHLVAELTQAALRERLGNRGVIRLRLDRRPARLLAEVRQISPQAEWIHEELVAPASPALRTAVLDVVRRSGAAITGLIAEDGRLDDLYRELVGRDGARASGSGCTEYSEDRT